MGTDRRSRPMLRSVLSTIAAISADPALLLLVPGAFMRGLLEAARRGLRGGGLGVAAGPVGELRERPAELAFQAGDVGAVADALEPFQHHRRLLAVLPDLFDGRLGERNRPAQRLGQDLRGLMRRSYVTGEIDLAAVQ